MVGPRGPVAMEAGAHATLEPLYRWEVRRMDGRLANAVVERLPALAELHARIQPMRSG